MLTHRMVLPALLGMAIMHGAAAQQPAADNTAGTEPLSQTPSNTNAGNSRTVWSPRLPTPAVDPDAAPAAFLEAARQAIAAGRTGEAQEALERAESRVLVRTVRPSKAGEPSRQPLVKQIAEARQTLAAGDRLGALRLLQAALDNPDAAEAE